MARLDLVHLLGQPGLLGRDHLPDPPDLVHLLDQLIPVHPLGLPDPLGRDHPLGLPDPLDLARLRRQPDLLDRLRLLDPRGLARQDSQAH
jgi:hypothetical protein